MRGRIIDFSVGLNRKQRVAIEIDGDFREGYEALKEVDIDVSLKKWREKRSKEANAYAWVLIDKIAAVLSLNKVEVYRDAIRDIGGVSDIVCVKNDAVKKLRENWQRNGIGWQTETMPSEIEGYTNVTLYYGSSSYDTYQMSLLIDHLVYEAKNLGIETMPDEQLKSLLEQFAKNCQKEEINSSIF